MSIRQTSICPQTPDNTMMAAPVRGSAPRARQQHQGLRPCCKALQAHAAAAERRCLRLRLRPWLLLPAAFGCLRKIQQSDGSWHSVSLLVWALPAALVAAGARQQHVGESWSAGTGGSGRGTGGLASRPDKTLCTTAQTLCVKSKTPWLTGGRSPAASAQGADVARRGSGAAPSPPACMDTANDGEGENLLLLCAVDGHEVAECHLLLQACCKGWMASTVA